MEFTAEITTLEFTLEVTGNSYEFTLSDITGNVNFNGFKAVNLGTPTADSDSATKKYVDDALVSVGAVTSVNTQTGAVVLDADDIDDSLTTHKFATSTIISNSHAPMSDNQDLSGYSLTSHNHTGVYAPVLGIDDNYVTDTEKIVIGNTSGTNTGDNATNSQYSGLAASKQDTLVSGTNIKTINSTSLLGSGDIVISGGAGAVDSVNSMTGTVVLDADDISDAATTNKWSSSGINSASHTQNTDSGTTGNTFTIDSDSTTGKIVLDVALNAGENHTMTVTNEAMTADVTVTLPATTGTVSLTSHNHSGVYEPAKGTDDNFVTDAEKIVIGNTSGTNSGDNATNSQYSGLATSKLSLDQTTSQSIINGQPIFDTLTAIQIVATDASKKLQTLAVASYPSLAELAHVKGVTSAIQTQLNGKQASGSYLVAADIAGKLDKSTYDANSILYATTDNTPVALTVGASTIVGRKSTGDIVALSATETRTILNVADGATANVGDMVLATAQSVTGAKTFDSAKLEVKGSSTGKHNFTSTNSGATNYALTLPNSDSTLEVVGHTQARTTIIANGVATLTPSTGDTVALDRNTYKGSIVTVPSGGTLTFTIANMAVGDSYLIKLAYAGTATINWFTTLKWINSGGTAPTYSATNGKVDTFIFFCRTSGNYDVHYQLDSGAI